MNKHTFQTPLLVWGAVFFFGVACILGKCSAANVSEAMRAEAAKHYAVSEIADRQPDARDIISAAEARTIADVIEAEKQYEQMDYEFFNGDAEAYPIGRKND